MTMKTTTILLMAAALAMAAACSNDDETTEQVPTQTQRPLTINVAENPFVNPDGSRSTRGEILTTSSTSFNAFTMHYVYGSSSSDPITVSKSNGKWSSTEPWPDTDDKVKWYAHTGGTFNLTDGPYLHFAVEKTVAYQKDLLVATTADTWAHYSGKLSFTFDHACAALRFHMKKAKNLSDYTLTVSEVKLCHVVKAGDYYYSTTSWILGTEMADYPLFSGSKTLGYTDYEAMDTNESTAYLFLIPQTLTAWNGSGSPTSTYLELDCTIKSGDTQVHSGKAYIPFGATLEKGTQYDVRLNIGKNSLYDCDGTKIIN